MDGPYSAAARAAMTLSAMPARTSLAQARRRSSSSGSPEALLLRVHNAQTHRGRLPGETEPTRRRLQHLSDLRSKLEAAIREEAYESAARLRDQIQELEAQPKQL